MSESMTSCPVRYHHRAFADGLLSHTIPLLLVFLAWIGSAPAQAADFSPGDLVVGLGSSSSGAYEGKLRHFSPDGTLLQTLLTTSGSVEETGACFDASYHLYTTNFEANSMSKFAPSASLLLPAFGSAFNQSPNSCVLDAAGALYVGLADKDGSYGGGGVLKLDTDGNVLASFTTIPDGRGTDWIDLAADQCTLYYTSVGASIKRFDLCQNLQLPDFCTACDDGAGSATAGTFFALRLLPDGSLLVADWNFAGNSGLVRRYVAGPDSTATQIMTYSTTNAFGTQCGPDFAQPCFFPWALALDPDHSSFWVADNVSGEIFRFDHGTGSVLSSFQGGDCSDLINPCAVTGLALVGEPTAAAPPSGGSSVTATITAANKVYDGTTAATITSCTLAGVPASADVSCVATGANFATPSVGNGKSVSATVMLTGSDAGSYTLSSPSASTTADITPAPAAVTPNPASKTYGAADPTFTGTLSGFLAADGVTATYGRAAGESVSGSPYTISATLSPAAALANYTVTYNTAAFTINKASASVTPNAASKTYGAADPTFTGTLSGFLAADGVTATYSRTAGESVAGGPYTIGATLSPAAALANYTVTYNTAGFTIDKANVAVTPNAVSKAYGTADPALAGTLSGFLAADGVTATYSRTAGESVAGSPYTISATLSPTGVLGNYTVAYNTASFTITPASASVTPNATSKTYGASDPVFTGSLSGFLPADSVTATYSRTAGESVAGSPYTISATLSPAGVLGNYAITYDTASFAINKANASVTPNAASKTYGIADPVFTGTLTGFLAADGVTATYSRTAGESVAGSPYAISATLSPAGVLGNYTVTYNSAAFTIDRANASVTPNAASKSYGATDPAFTGTLSGFLPADGVTAVYSRTAGESVAGGPYTISATLSPAGMLGNYHVTYDTAAFTITPATASVTPNVASKTYGAADPALSGTLSGFLLADGITATYGRTTGESVAGSPYTISATLSPSSALANYAVTYNTAAFTISKASASVTPNAAGKPYATADPALSGTLSGFLSTDGVAATYSRSPGESVTGGPYTISAVLTSAGALGNYTITYNTAPFTITKLNATVTPNAATKTYGTPDPVLTGSLSGFLPSDGVTATFSRAAGETVVGSPYAISGALSPAAALGNYNITYNTAGLSVTPATPILTWANPADITYPTPLSATQLNAAANVPGAFAYTPPAGTVLDVGNGQLLSVLFTPTDNSDYTTATAQVYINVLPSAPASCPEDPSAVLTLAVDNTGAAHGSVPVYQTVQAAYNAASNGDVIGMFSQTTENVVLGGAKTLTITQCTVAKITAQDNTQPVWNITSTGALTIIGPDAVGGSIGWRIGTSNHTVKSVRSTGASQYGILVVGNNDSVSVNSVSGSPVGIRVTGNSNDLRPGGAVSGNSGNGVEIGSSATGNTVRIGNIQSNGGNGIQVDGSSNTVTSNSRIDNNTLNGILVNGSSNTIKSNAAGSDKNKGNGQAGIKVVGGSNTIDSNTANANGGVGLDLVGTGNKLKSNQSDQTSQNGAKENVGCEYRFSDGTTQDQGGNKKDNVNFVGTLSGPRYAAGCSE